MSKAYGVSPSTGKRYILEGERAGGTGMHLSQVARVRFRILQRGALGDTLFRGLTILVAIGVVALLGVIAGVLLIAASASIRTFGPGFLTGVTWDSVADVYGAAPFVSGTLVTSALALLLGVPISLGIAIFLSELAPAKVRVPLTYVVELLAAVPSVVYGLWGIFVLAPAMASVVEPSLQGALGFLPFFQGAPRGADKFSAGVILAIMIIPTISAVSREALRAVPQSQREAALSLGATRWESTRIAVLRDAPAGIFGAIVLGLGRAVGETMAVTMMIGNWNGISLSLLDPGQTIASLIANNFGEGGPVSLQKSALIELGLVLMLMSLVINVLARLMLWRG